MTRFEQFGDIERVVIWVRDGGDGIIKVIDMEDGYESFNAEVNGDMLVIEEEDSQ